MNPATAMPASATAHRRLLRAAACLLAAAVLAGVFALYLSPHLVVDLTNRVWACF